MPRVETHAPGDFCWYDLFSADLTKSNAFYAGLFGWTAQDQPTQGPNPYTMFLRGEDPVVGGGQMSEEMLKGGVPSSWQVYVSVEELEPVLERAEANGGKVAFPPMDVMEFGRLAYFTDPEGAMIALWQPKDSIGAYRQHEAGTVCWVELASRDITKAAAFYAKIFGWDDVDNPAAPPTGYRTLKNGDCDVGGILQMTEEWGDMPAHWSVYFEVDDIDPVTTKVEELGGAVKFGPFDTPVGQIAVCADDVGAHFYLMQLNDAMKAAR